MIALDYFIHRIEIYISSIDWLVLIIGGALLSVLFKRAQLT